MYANKVQWPSGLNVIVLAIRPELESRHGQFVSEVNSLRDHFGETTLKPLTCVHCPD